MRWRWFLKIEKKIYLQVLQVSICAKNIWRQFLYRITGQDTKNFNNKKIKWKVHSKQVNCWGIFMHFKVRNLNRSKKKYFPKLSDRS